MKDYSNLEERYQRNLETLSRIKRNVAEMRRYSDDELRRINSNQRGTLEDNLLYQLTEDNSNLRAMLSSRQGIGSEEEYESLLQEHGDRVYEDVFGVEKPTNNNTKIATREQVGLERQYTPSTLVQSGDRSYPDLTIQEIAEQTGLKNDYLIQLAERGLSVQEMVEVSTVLSDFNALKPKVLDLLDLGIGGEGIGAVYRANRTLFEVLPEPRRARREDYESEEGLGSRLLTNYASLPFLGHIYSGLGNDREHFESLIDRLFERKNLSTFDLSRILHLINSGGCIDPEYLVESLDGSHVRDQLTALFSDDLPEDMKEEARKQQCALYPDEWESHQ